MTTDQLIEKAVNKDPDAFCQLCQQFMPDMYRTALAILMNDEDTADAIQDTILTCWEKAGTLRKPEYFKTWLIRIVINKSNDILRKNRKYADIEEVPEAAAEDNVNLELKEALARLDAKYRLPVILYYYEGYSSDEIAKILKLPQSTVLTRLQRAREKLRTELEDVPEGPQAAGKEQRSGNTKQAVVADNAKKSARPGNTDAGSGSDKAKKEKGSEYNAFSRRYFHKQTQ